MKRIGLLSDTHGHWDERYARYFAECDEVWHAGDIGSLELAERFEAFRPFRAVYGNIDGRDIRLRYPEINHFTIEGADVLIKHIGGYPGNLDTGYAMGQPSYPLHQWPFSHPQGDARPPYQHTAHQPRCRRHPRISQGTHPRTLHHRWRRIQQP